MFHKIVRRLFAPLLFLDVFLLLGGLYTHNGLDTGIRRSGNFLPSQMAECSNESAFTYRIKFTETRGNSPAYPNRSTVKLYEDGKLLWPTADVALGAIYWHGNGRYCHNKKTIYFTASDNSDPRTNGRTYSYTYSKVILPGLGRGLLFILYGVLFAQFLLYVPLFLKSMARPAFAPAVRKFADLIRRARDIPASRIMTPIMAINIGLLAVGVFSYNGINTGERFVKRLNSSLLAPVAGDNPTNHVRIFTNDIISPSVAELVAFRMFEGARPLPRQNSTEDDIRRIGMGRYRHSGGTLIFTSSDNSSPQTNGRAYSYAYNNIIFADP